MKAEDRPSGAELWCLWMDHAQNHKCGYGCQTYEKLKLQYTHMQKDRQSHRERAID